MVCNFLSRETLYSNRVTSENKRIHTPSPVASIQSSDSLLFSIGSSNSGTTLDGGGKAIYFPLLRSVKGKKAQFRANCRNSFCR